METTEIESIKNVNEMLTGFTGTDLYHKVIGGLLITDGVLYLCDNWNCHWLLDIISSHQTRQLKESFQVWRLKRLNKDKFYVTCDDGRDTVLVKQMINFSDFKDDQVTVYCENGVICLPTER